MFDMLKCHVHALVHFGKQSFEIVYIHMSSAGALAPLLAASLTGAPTPRAGRGDAVLCRNDGSHWLAHDGAAQVARCSEIENDDRQAVLHAQRDRGGVHHTQSLVD